MGTSEQGNVIDVCIHKRKSEAEQEVYSINFLHNFIDNNHDYALFVVMLFLYHHIHALYTEHLTRSYRFIFLTFLRD